MDEILQGWVWRRIQFLKDSAGQSGGTVYKKPWQFSSGTDNEESYREPLYKIRRLKGAKLKRRSILKGTAPRMLTMQVYGVLSY